MTSHASRRPVSVLRERMIEDMTVRGFNAKTRNDYVRTFVAQQLHQLTVGVDQSEAIGPAVLDVGSRQPEQDGAKATALIRNDAGQLRGEVIGAAAAVVEDQPPAGEIGPGRASDLNCLVLIDAAVVVVQLVDENGRRLAGDRRR